MSDAVQAGTALEADILQPGGNIEIEFAHVADLDQAQLVRPDFKISLPLVHDVPAAGMTAAELRAALVRKYQATELKSPELVVIIRDVNPNETYLGSEAKYPRCPAAVDAEDCNAKDFSGQWSRAYGTGWTIHNHL